MAMGLRRAASSVRAAPGAVVNAEGSKRLKFVGPAIAAFIAKFFAATSGEEGGGGGGGEEEDDGDGSQMGGREGGVGGGGSLKSPRRYVPRARSGNYAVLVVLDVAAREVRRGRGRGGPPAAFVPTASHFSERLAACRRPGVHGG